MLFRKNTERDELVTTRLWAKPDTNTRQGFSNNVKLDQVVRLRPQAYKDTSSDGRKNLSSFFAYGKRVAEADAFKQAHMTPSGVPGVVNLGILNPQTNQPVPYANFEWNGRQFTTDMNGVIKFIERDYFQTAISLENERVKYVTQMISLVAGQPAENVIHLFGWDFYLALAGDNEGIHGPQARQAQLLYHEYVHNAGLDPMVATRKEFVFQRYSDAECSPEVMCNFGENDPEWCRAFNKLALLIEFYPTSIITDHGTLNPLDSSGTVHGDKGSHNPGSMPDREQERLAIMDKASAEDLYPGAGRMLYDRDAKVQVRDMMVAARAANVASSSNVAAPAPAPPPSST